MTNRSKLRTQSILIPLCALALMACSSESKKSLSGIGAGTVVSDDDKRDLFDSSQFKLVFETPVGQVTKVSSTGLNIKIAPQNPPPTATWNLYYSRVFKDLSALRTIFEGLPINVHEVDWNTANLPSGDYYLVAETIAGKTRALFWLGSKIEVTAGSVGDAPKVVISPATDGRIFGPSDSLALDYLAVTPNGKPALFDVFLSSDGGTTWQQLEDGTETKRVTLKFDTTFVKSARYRVKVEAESDGTVGSAQTEGFFGYTPAPITWNVDLAPAVIKNKCQSCHEVGAAPRRTSPQGGFIATSWSDVVNDLGSFKGVNTSKTSIYQRTRADAASPMPPLGSGMALTDEERDLIALWAWGQYKQAP